MKHRWTTLLWELFAAQLLCTAAAMLPGSIAAAVHSSCAAHSSHKRVIQRCFIVHRPLFSTF